MKTEIERYLKQIEDVTGPITSFGELKIQVRALKELVLCVQGNRKLTSQADFWSLLMTGLSRIDSYCQAGREFPEEQQKEKKAG